MKIESSGFTVTEICEQIPNILVTSAGMVLITMRLTAGGLVTSGEMSTKDFAELHAAMDAVRDRLEGDALALRVDRKTNDRPLVIIDKSSDVWIWRDDHSAYVIAINGHENCERDGTLDDGSTLEYIKDNYGPVTVIK